MLIYSLEINQETGLHINLPDFHVPSTISTTVIQDMSANKLKQIAVTINS